MLKRPYLLDRMNQLESAALLVLVFSLYLCVFFSTPGITETVRQVHST